MENWTLFDINDKVIIDVLSNNNKDAARKLKKVFQLIPRSNEITTKIDDKFDTIIEIFCNGMLIGTAVKQ